MTHEFDHPAAAIEEAFILLADLHPIVPLHPQHIRKLVRKGEFPAIYKVGGRTAFKRREIQEWCRAQSPIYSLSQVGCAKQRPVPAAPLPKE